MILWILWNPFRNQLWTPRYSTSQRTQRKPLMRSESLEALKPQDSPECTNHVCLLCLGRPKYSKNIVSSRGTIFWRGSFTRLRYALTATRGYSMSKRNTRETNILSICLSRIPYENILRSFTLKNWSLCGQDIHTPLMARGWGAGSKLRQPNGAHRHVYPEVGRTSFKKRFQMTCVDNLYARCSKCICNTYAICHNKKQTDRVRQHLAGPNHHTILYGGPIK